MTATITEATTSRFAQAGSVRIHYNEVGTGEPVICLHGAGPGASSWSNFSGNVEAFAQRHRVLLVDMPQYGKSDKIAIPGPRLSAIAPILRDFMDAVGIERAHFVGNSMGGQVALKFTLDHPERVGRVVAIGSTPVAYSVFSPFPAEAVKLIGSYYGGSGPSIEKMRTLLRTFVYDPSLVTDALVTERYQVSIDPELIRVNAGPRPEREDLTADLPRIAAPTLLMWGLDDRAGPLDVGILMTRAMPNAEMHIFNHCGHWAQVEHRDEFNEIVLAFLARR
jgi:pimeloyl-ACP methyl ester carboxylesterase